jgi:tryptophan synthase beta chain
MTNSHQRTSFQEENAAFVPPLLEPALRSLQTGFKAFLADKAEQTKLNRQLHEFAGRPTPLTEAPRLGQLYGGRIFLKREDLLHGGAHKLNNALGQCALAQFMGFNKVIAETGAGQHGVATAIACARLGLKARVFQGAKDAERQAPNALRMRLLGAELIPVHDGSSTLKEAVNAAMREWVTHSTTQAYCLGSVVGPAPYPAMVRHFQRIIGDETAAQLKSQFGIAEPDALVACVGGGSNAAGFFTSFQERGIGQLIGCEAAGAASLINGKPGTLHGMESLVLQTADRQIAETHSISAGLDYPAVGPWLAGLKEAGKLTPCGISDAEALQGLRELSHYEGIICALETAHAVAGAKKFLSTHPASTVVICLSGRGDKDLGIIGDAS